MNLDDAQVFARLDPQNMIGEIDRLPDQLLAAWNTGQRAKLPEFGELRQVVIAGMGGSAIGGDLLVAFLREVCSLPVHVWRNYGLPGFANGPRTLVVACSHSGNTEETLSACETAYQRGCRVLAITTGGALAEGCATAGIPVWQYAHTGQPRAAVGWSFGLLLALFARLGLAPDAGAAIQGAVAAMQTQQANLRVDSPVSRNPAKRAAGQLVGRWVAVFGQDMLEPVARRWKTQINEVGKAWAQFEFLPEADHNTLAGLENPEIQSQTALLFLRAPSDHPRNRLRSDLTRQQCMLAGLNTDYFDAPGDIPLAQQWTALHFGDYLAYYLAMAYGVDPTPVDAIESLKSAMRP